MFISLVFEGEPQIAFTAFRTAKPYDVLTENNVGSIIARKGTFYVIAFDAGNFMRPWTHGEEVIVLIEVATSDEVLYDVKTITLDQGVDIQEIPDIDLEIVPEVHSKKNTLTWRAVEDDPVIGYSLYEGERRLNDEILIMTEFTSRAENVTVRPVIQGGYETVLSPTGVKEQPQVFTPVSYAFNVFPNPFIGYTSVNYALPHRAQVDIAVYDVTGRLTRNVVSGIGEPGVYTVNWDGRDDIGRSAAAGVYFITITTDDYQSKQKVILVR
jgi:hypothetical protein